MVCALKHFLEEIAKIKKKEKEDMVHKLLFNKLGLMFKQNNQKYNGEKDDV